MTKAKAKAKTTTKTVRARTRKLTVEPGEAEKHTDSEEEGFMSVRRSAYGSEEETLEKVRVPDLAKVLKGAPPARVRLGGGITRNLGDFNSARVDVMIELPCLPVMEEVDRVVALISSRLDDIIPSELEKAMTPPDGEQT